ncbi:MAG TPA: arylesterase [Gemmatimonadales bacterium]|nr:arylesterase [Gemmatimonadales bacterium]
MSEVRGDNTPVPLKAKRALLAALTLAAACTSRAAPSSPPAAESVAAATTADARPTIVFLGTSLTAGLGLDPGDAYPALIQQKLDSAHLAYRVVNAGVSGETSAGALRRIDWVLQGPVGVLVIETGANDGLRGQDPDSTRAHIEAIISKARARRPVPAVALVQMRALPNYGPEYGRRFDRLYPAVADREHVTLFPFLLARVAGIDSLNQPDGIHPNVRGERIVADNVWHALLPLLDSISAQKNPLPPSGRN